jgi:hypothetical protein
MLVFVDESGDPGLKLGQGSSNCFTVAIVIFDDRDVALACNEAINQLRVNLGFDRRQEFKFNKCSREVRESFFRTVSPYRFQYHAVVLNKAELTSPGFQHKESLYKFPIKLVFQNAKPLLKGATVFFDTCGSREFVRQLGVYLRKHTTEADGSCEIRKMKPERSHNNNLIQLADMVCGAVARSFKGDKKDRLVYRAIIQEKEVRVQFWPK